MVKISGLLMKWMSRNTPTCRMWYCDRLPPEPPDALRIAAALSAKQFGGRDPQSSAFFRGPAGEELAVGDAEFRRKYWCSELRET